MQLAAFSALVDAPPGWCRNALAVLGLPCRYSLQLARVFGLARLLHVHHDLPLKEAVRIARIALAANAGEPMRRGDDLSIATLEIDPARYLTVFAVRLGEIRRTPPAGRGRPRNRPARPARGGAVARAAAYGLDVGALRAGLRLTPAERLERLDANQRLVGQLRAGVRTA